MCTLIQVGVARGEVPIFGVHLRAEFVQGWEKPGTGFLVVIPVAKCLVLRFFTEPFEFVEFFLCLEESELPKSIDHVLRAMLGEFVGEPSILLDICQK
jgi:hypothetical protein